MSPEVVYRSSHPDVLAYWKAAQDADQAWRERVQSALAEIGFADHNFVMRGQNVIGVAHPVSEPIPHGWRKCSDLAGAIVPARNTREGKRIGLALDGLKRPDPRSGMPGGMPASALEGRLVRIHPGIELDGDVVWVSWSGPLGEQDADRIDPAVWERVPLSQYWAMREAAEGGAA